jgi:hypothetical protein
VLPSVPIFFGVTYILCWRCIISSVVDRHCFDADPDPTLNFDADPDPDPDPTPSLTHFLLFTLYYLFRQCHKCNNFQCVEQYIEIFWEGSGSGSTGPECRSQSGSVSTLSSATVRKNHAVLGVKYHFPKGGAARGGGNNYPFSTKIYMGCVKSFC